MMTGTRWLAGLVLVLAVCCARSTFSIGRLKASGAMLPDGTLNSPAFVYGAGCVSGILLVPLLANILKKLTRYLISSKDDGAHGLYRLDHGILNVELPPTSMWMNMGYWKVQ